MVITSIPSAIQLQFLLKLQSSRLHFRSTIITPSLPFENSAACLDKLYPSLLVLIIIMLT
mgnify:CR=1 FL=1